MRRGMSQKTSPGRSSTVLARTAPWGLTRTRSRSSVTTTNLYAQGYFVYDSKKAGSRTVSHLRISPKPIESTYLITQADFVAVHQFDFLESIDALEIAAPGATDPDQQSLSISRNMGSNTRRGTDPDPGQEASSMGHRRRQPSLGTQVWVDV